MSISTSTLPAHRKAAPVVEAMSEINEPDISIAADDVVGALRLLASTVLDTVERIARRIAVPVLLGGLALIMIWFGAPKLVPGGSPAEAIAVDTISVLTGGLVAGDTARVVLGIVEVGLGVAVLIPALRRLALVAMLGHMAATFTPLFLFPDATWHAPFVGSMEGQYILKNILVVGVILVLLGFARPRRP